MSILKNVQTVISQIFKKESDYDSIKQSYANVFQIADENEKKSGLEQIILKVNNILNLQNHNWRPQIPTGCKNRIRFCHLQKRHFSTP